MINTTFASLNKVDKPGSSRKDLSDLIYPCFMEMRLNPYYLNNKHGKMITLKQIM